MTQTTAKKMTGWGTGHQDTVGYGEAAVWKSAEGKRDLWLIVLPTSRRHPRCFGCYTHVR